MKQPAPDADAAARGERLRLVMRRVPSPVTVVTAGTEAPRGVTIGSFTSLSLSPPLIQFNLMEASHMRPVLREGDRFHVHVLRDDQAVLAYHFAIPGLSSEGQFLAVPHTLDAHGLPVLAEKLSLLRCHVHQLVETGDHVLVVGEVEAVEGPEAGAPLLYLDGTFRAVGDEIEVSPADLTGGEMG